MPQGHPPDDTWSCFCVLNSCELCTTLSLHTDYDKQRKLLHLNDLVSRSGQPNYLSCRVPIESRFNIDYIEAHMQGYHDTQILDFLKFGWPIDHDGREVNSIPPRNHDSATRYGNEVHDYLRKELAYGATIGPFARSPFQEPGLSPLSTRPKRGSEERRIIVDMSFPPGRSINDGIDKHTYQGEPVKLTYPSVDSLVQIMIRKGRGCLLFKKDLKRAYRQIPVDPADIRLLGYQWDDHLFFDTVLAMGCRSSAYICQRTTNLIRHIYSTHGHDCANYLDDVGACEIAPLAPAAHHTLGGVIEDSGLEESLPKDWPPDYTMEWLGVLLNSLEFTLSVTPDRILELKQELTDWLDRAKYHRKQLESLLGKLNFVVACVYASRAFIARLLNVLRQTPLHGSIPTPDELRSDVRWWYDFMESYNGTSAICTFPWSDPDEVISSDACLIAGGALSSKQFFHKVFPKYVVDMNLHINALELLTLVVAVRVFEPDIRGKCFVMYCELKRSLYLAKDCQVPLEALHL